MGWRSWVLGWLLIAGFSTLTAQDLARFAFDSLPSVDLVIAKAQSLRGRPYDFWRGDASKIGAGLGWIVCADIPTIAYEMAGLSLRRLVSYDYRQHPGAYPAEPDNTPDNPFFHRRVRNLYAFFKANGRLWPPQSRPARGDLVFYRDSPHGPVSHVTLVTSTGSNHYFVMESSAATLIAQEVSDLAPVNRGAIVAGFGRLY